MEAQTNVEERRVQLIDLPDGFLLQVIQHLDCYEKKNLALVNHHLCNLIRSQWENIYVDVYATDPIPKGLAHFTGLRNVYWAHNMEQVEQAREDWPDNPPLDPPANTMPAVTAAQQRRLATLHELLFQAGTLKVDQTCASSIQYDHHQQHTTAPRLVENQINPTTQNALRQIHLCIAYPFSTSTERIGAILRHCWHHIKTLSKNRQTFGELDDIGDIVGSVSGCMSPTMEQHRAAAVKELEDIVAAAAGQDVADLDEDLVSDVLHKHFELNPLNPRALARETAQYLGQELLEKRVRFAESRELLFQTIDAGWMTLDGLLQSKVVKASTAFCPGYPPRLDAYTNLEQLRLTGCDCDDDEENYSGSFATAIAPQLAKLPQLKELHLGRGFENNNFLQLDPRDLQLPALTRLVLNEMVLFSSFDEFTHLTSLESLSIALTDGQWEVGDNHSQDLHSLTKLPSLRRLSLDFWRVEEPQQHAIASLTQLTELSFENVAGNVHFIKPAAPMPNLLGITMTKIPRHSDMRYREDSRFARWLLRKAPPLFPNAEVMQFGTLGTGPSFANNEKMLRQAASMIDSTILPFLCKLSTSVEYLQLDTVIDIHDYALRKKCTSGALELVNPEIVALQRVCDDEGVENDGDAGGSSTGGSAQQQAYDIAGNANAPNSLHNQQAQQPQHVAMDVESEEEEEDTDTDDADVAWMQNPFYTSRPSFVVSQWERSVEFITHPVTEVVVAEFHYAKKKPEATSEEDNQSSHDDGDDGDGHLLDFETINKQWYALLEQMRKKEGS